MTPEIQNVIRSLAKNPAHRTDEWLNECTRLLARRHNAELFKEGPNLLPNPGFEATGADGLPEGWKRRDYGNRTANTEAEWNSITGTANARSGQHALRCVTRGDADTSLYARVTLKPNTLYRLSGWVKARNLRGKLSLNDHLGRAETERLTRDGDWRLVEVDYNSAQPLHLGLVITVKTETLGVEYQHDIRRRILDIGLQSQQAGVVLFLAGAFGKNCFGARYKDKAFGREER